MSSDYNVKPLNLYKVLELPPPGSGHVCSNAEIKAAYRKALLKFHPDKGKLLGLESDEKQRDERFDVARYSIDDIGKARDTLLDPISRKTYDHKFRLLSATEKLSTPNVPPMEGTGYETIDLEDMEFSESNNSYWMACRCGNETAFRISEDELARDADQGEVLIGCPGCSLTVKIIFEALPG